MKLHPGNDSNIVRIRSRFAAILLVAASVAYGCIWSFVGISKILSLNAYAFDLGVSSERGWVILHTNLGLHGYLLTLLNSGIVFPLSPLTGSGNFMAMVVFQAFSIAIVAPALYYISRAKGLGIVTSLIVGGAFLLYFPVYGIMWFDFHYQAFFFPLFILGYLFYIKGYYLLSFLLFLLSGMVRFPYSIFPLAFALIELYMVFCSRKSGVQRDKLASLTALSVIMFLLTALGTLYFGLVQSVPGTAPIALPALSWPFFQRLAIIALFLGPLLFLPALSPRWLALALPGFFLILASSYTGYSYQHIFQGQYISGIAPFLLLGFIDSIVYIKNNRDKLTRPSLRKLPLSSLSNSYKLTVSSVIVLILLNMVFAPFGPLNSFSHEGFNFHGNTSYNISQYNELNHMISLIPQNQSYVAFQNNIPEIMPRAMPLNNSIALVGGLWNLSGISVYFAANNSWPVLFNGQVKDIAIYYAIADTENSNYYLGNNSMASLIHAMLSSGKYGIRAEGYGLVLLEWDY